MYWMGGCAACAQARNVHSEGNGNLYGTRLPRYNRLITIVNSIHRNCESFDHSKCVSISNRLRQTLWWAHNSNVNSNLIGPAHTYQFLLLRFRRRLTKRLAFKVLPMLVSLAPCDMQYWHTKNLFRMNSLRCLTSERYRIVLPGFCCRIHWIRTMTMTTMTNATTLPCIVSSQMLLAVVVESVGVSSTVVHVCLWFYSDHGIFTWMNIYTKFS